jgi:sec-independent protein translocase protein TatC
VIFGYLLILTPAINLLLGFATETIIPMLSVNSYLSFVTHLLLAFGIVFELPVVIFFLVHIGVIDISFLIRNRKYALLIAFIIASILTPPDILSQLMMAGPLILLYELSILAARCVYVYKKRCCSRRKI